METGGWGHNNILIIADNFIKVRGGGDGGWGDNNILRIANNFIKVRGGGDGGGGGTTTFL